MFAAAFMAVAVMSGACNRADEQAPPAAEMQTQTPAQPTNQQVSVTGCLRAGETEGTFVLTASQAEQPGPASTYTLTPAANMDLQEHIGQRVAVTGTVTSQQEIAARTGVTPVPNSGATGTSGTPSVQTTTEVDIRRLELASLRALGERCEG